MTTNNDYEALKNQYAEEVKQRWGNTEAYKESQQRNTDFSKSAASLDAVLEEFAELNRSGVSPNDEPAKVQVEKLQQCITDNFYTCTTAKAQQNISRRVSNHISKNNRRASGSSVPFARFLIISC